MHYILSYYTGQLLGLQLVDLYYYIVFHETLNRSTTPSTFKEQNQELVFSCCRINFLELSWKNEFVDLFCFNIDI